MNTFLKVAGVAGFGMVSWMIGIWSCEYLYVASPTFRSGMSELAELYQK